MSRRWTPVDADRERRDRGVTKAQWQAAPAAPLTREDCPTALGRSELGDVELGPAAWPCPHLRCVHHNGLYGDPALSCELDVAELAAAERTQTTVARALGCTQPRVALLEGHARDDFERQAPPASLKLLGIRRRHA